MTPLHMEILLHYYTVPNPFPRSSDCINEYRTHLEHDGLITRQDTQWVVTDKGKAWIRKALDTPMPTQKRVWE